MGAYSGARNTTCSHRRFHVLRVPAAMHYVGLDEVHREMGTNGIKRSMPRTGISKDLFGSDLQEI